MPFAPAPEAAANVDGWLYEARQKALVFPNVKVGPLTTYPNPRYLVRGFEIDCGSSVLVTVIVALGAEPLQITAKCRPGYERTLRQILGSIRPDTEVGAPPAPGSYSYSAAGCRFESPQALEEPAYLTLRAKIGFLRIQGTAATHRLKRTRPAWGSSFGLGPSEVVTEVLQGRRIIAAARVAVDSTPLSFKREFWLSPAREGNTEHELCLAQARSASPLHFFRFEMKAQDPGGPEQVELFDALLASARGATHGG